LTDKLWRRDPASLPPPTDTPGGRRIQGDALIDLQGLQMLLRRGDFDTEDLWIATSKCAKDLRKEGWSSDDVLQMLVCLTPQDCYRSEWCEISAGHSLPCDAYRLPYDARRQCRTDKGGLRVYLKFSVDEEGGVTITLVSCHEG